jgi:hypothetical protein
MSFWKRVPKIRIEWDKDKVAMAGLAALYLLFVCITLYNVLGNHYRAGFVTIFGTELEIGDAYRDTTDQVSWWMTVGAVVLGALGLLYRRMAPRVQTLYFGALLAFVCGALLLAYMKPGILKDYYADTGDSFNYFIVPKYYEPLGYREGYNCAMTAQIEKGRKLPRRMRDLGTNRMVRVKERVTPDVQERCRARFGEARWAEYVQDIDTYRSWFSQRRWDHWFIDHGYNGTPVRSVFATAIANAVDLSIENLSLLALLTSFAITAMLMVVVRAFGWRMGLFFAALFCVNFPDRFILAGAFLRYFWLASLVIGVSLLKMKRYGWSAGFLVFSSLFQIFPVLFLGGMGIKIAWELIQHRRVAAGHRRFIVSGLATALVLLTLSVSIGQGFTNWREFLHQMDLNSGRMATGRIGYLYNFLYPKEVLPTEKQGPYQDKVRQANAQSVAGPVTLMNLKNITTVLILVAVILLAGKTNETEYTLILGFALFFMLFSTVRYYYAGLVGFPLVYYRHIREWPGQIYVLAMLVVMGVIYLVQPYTIYSFAYNTLLTAAFTAMLVGTTVFMYLRKPPAVAE